MWDQNGTTSFREKQSFSWNDGFLRAEIHWNFGAEWLDLKISNVKIFIILGGVFLEGKMDVRLSDPFIHYYFDVCSRDPKTSMVEPRKCFVVHYSIFMLSKKNVTCAVLFLQTAFNSKIRYASFKIKFCHCNVWQLRSEQCAMSGDSSNRFFVIWQVFTTPDPPVIASPTCLRLL